MNRVEGHGSLYYLFISDIHVRLSWKKMNKQFPRNDHVKKERKKKRKEKKICSCFTILLKNKLSF